MKYQMLFLCMFCSSMSAQERLLNNIYDLFAGQVKQESEAQSKQLGQKKEKGAMHIALASGAETMMVGAAPWAVLRMHRGEPLERDDADTAMVVSEILTVVFALKNIMKAADATVSKYLLNEQIPSQKVTQLWAKAGGALAALAICKLCMLSAQDD